MLKFAVLNNDKVINVIVADDKETAETVTGFTCIESNTAGIGCTWDGKDFSAPVVELTE